MSSDEQRERFLVQAAVEARWHDPALASRVIDLPVSELDDARKLVGMYADRYPQVAEQERVTAEEQARRHGAEILDALDRQRAVDAGQDPLARR